MDLTEKKPSRNLLNEQSFKTTGEALDLVSSKFDVLVVGAGTAGIYFAQKMAEAKYTVCVIEKSDEKDLGSRLNIFHIDKVKFEEFNVPEPKPGDEDFVDVFNFSISKSAEDKYPKKVEYPFVVSLLPKFLKRLKNQAVKAGVTFVFETTFNDFIYNDQKQIIGANVKTNKGNKQISARLVVDASGIPAVARTKLPLNSKVENFTLSPRDMFYVTLRYVKLKNPKTDAIKFTTSWPYYKTWTAPSLDPNGAIYGVGSNLSFETGEKIYQEFIKHVKLPEATLDKIEKGYVPYHRSPYSLVTDGFICLGDAACMTKPYSGEGIVAAWTFAKIAAEVAIEVMIHNQYPTEELLWPANIKYAHTQGADFAAIMATLVGAVDATIAENDYEFKRDIIFSAKALTSMNVNFNADMSPSDTIKTVGKILVGLISGKIKFKTIKGLMKSMGVANKLKKHYHNFPTHPNNFWKWKNKCDNLWKKAGSMADKLEGAK